MVERNDLDLLKTVKVTIASSALVRNVNADICVSSSLDEVNCKLKIDDVTFIKIPSYR